MNSSPFDAVPDVKSVVQAPRALQPLVGAGVEAGLQSVRVPLVLLFADLEVVLGQLRVVGQHVLNRDLDVAHDSSILVTFRSVKTCLNAFTAMSHLARMILGCSPAMTARSEEH